MIKTNSEVQIVLEDETGKKWVSGDTYGALLTRIGKLEGRISELSQINEQLNIVFEALGDDFWIKYFKAKFLAMLQVKARHEYELTRGTLYHYRCMALEQLFEDKLIEHHGGWVVRRK